MKHSLRSYDEKSACSLCHKKCEPPDLTGIMDKEGVKEICPECRNLFGTCDLCGEDFLREKLGQVENQWYCRECLQEQLVELKEEEQEACEAHNHVLIQRIAMVAPSLRALITSSLFSSLYFLIISCFLSVLLNDLTEYIR